MLLHHFISPSVEWLYLRIYILKPFFTCHINYKMSSNSWIRTIFVNRKTWNAKKFKFWNGRKAMRVRACCTCNGVCLCMSVCVWCLVKVNMRELLVFMQPLRNTKLIQPMKWANIMYISSTSFSSSTWKKCPFSCRVNQCKWQNPKWSLITNLLRCF